MNTPCWKMLLKVLITVAFLAESTHTLTMEMSPPSPVARFMSTTETPSPTRKSSSNLNTYTFPSQIFEPLATVTGPGPSSIYQCWSSFNTYRDWTFLTKVRGKIATDSYLKPITHTLPYSRRSQTYVNASIPRTTLCDGHPRLLAPATTDLSLTYTNVSSTSIFVPTPTSPKPSCTILEAECTIISSVWSKASASWSSSFEATERRNVGLYNLFNIPFRPFCTTTNKPCVANRCEMYPQEATVFYWPTSTVNGNVCGSPGATITPIATIQEVPNTAVFQSATLVSPSVYVVFSTVWVYSIAPKGEPYSPMSMCAANIPRSVTLSLHPSDISSVRYSMSSTSTSFSREASSYTFPTMVSSTLLFNFADMDVNQRPWEAYAGAFHFWDKPVWQEMDTFTHSLIKGPTSKTRATMLAEYSPILAVPKVVTNLGDAGEFVHCGLHSTLNSVTYVPITATTVVVPESTWLASTVGSNAMETHVGPHKM